MQLDVESRSVNYRQFAKVLDAADDLVIGIVKGRTIRSTSFSCSLFDFSS